MAEQHPIARWRASQTPPWSQDRFGEAVGVDGMTVYRWEAGVAFPQRRHWPKITEVTEIPIVDILLAGAAPTELGA